MRTRALILTGAVLPAFLSVAAAQADWPNFRGPNHDGVARESNLQTTWTTPIPQVWDLQIGSAYSSFAAVGKRVYTCGIADDHQVLYAINADTGKVDWSTRIEKIYKDSWGDGARATPTVNDGRVYVLGALGRLICVNAADGAVVWSKQFNDKPQWGYAASVLVDGDLAISTAGKNQGSIVAFDKTTGAQRWQAGEDPAGYSTPYPFIFQGRKYVVGFTGKSALLVERDSGRIALRIPWKTDWKVNAAAPIYHDGHLLLTSGYTTGAAVFKLGTDGENLTAEKLWKSKVLLNKFQSCILHEGKLYTSDEKSLKCVDFLTGEKIWDKRRLESASSKNGTLVLADGYLYFFSEDGKLLIAEASPGDFNPTTVAEILSGRCWTVPVIHDGKLFVRNLERAACFNLKP